MTWKIFGKKVGRSLSDGEKELNEVHESRIKKKQQLELFKKDRIIDELEWHYIDEVQSLHYPTKRSFEILADSKVMESDFFIIKKKPFVCFADLSENDEYGNFLLENMESITDAFESKNWNFVYRINPVVDQDLKKLNTPYFFPNIDWDNVDIDLQYQSFSEPIAHIILRFYKYAGPIKTGFLYIEKNKFVFVSKKQNETIEDFVQNYLLFLRRYAPDKYYAVNPELDFDLDNETRKILFDIKDSLDELKKNGKFFALAPVLLKMIEEASKESPKISRMVIDKDFRILLPDYQNKEIKLSHLTKSLYLLFLKHPRGIYCRDFKIYEEELLGIYKKVSYRLDLNKMKDSVIEMRDPKVLRTHISRIKSAFLKEFSDFYASKYYVIGGETRTILLDRELLSLEIQI